jgi:hypothetical protein
VAKANELEDELHEIGKQHNPRNSYRPKSGGGDDSPCFLGWFFLLLFWLASQLITPYSPAHINRFSSFPSKGFCENFTSL